MTFKMYSTMMAGLHGISVLTVDPGQAVGPAPWAQMPLRV